MRYFLHIWIAKAVNNIFFPVSYADSVDEVVFNSFAKDLRVNLFSSRTSFYLLPVITLSRYPFLISL